MEYPEDIGLEPGEPNPFEGVEPSPQAEATAKWRARRAAKARGEHVPYESKREDDNADA